MTKKEIEKKFKFSGKDGECSGCEYGDHCDKILPGFNKPGKCGGPFEKDDEKKSKKRNTIKINESQLHNMIAKSVKNIISEWNGWHQTLNFEQAIRELREAWSNYCVVHSSLTTDDQRYVESLIDYLEENYAEDQI